MLRLTFVMVLCGISVSGCSNKPEVTRIVPGNAMPTKTGAPTTKEDLIKSVENDPTMPPEVKARALSQLQNVTVGPKAGAGKSSKVTQ